MTDKRTFFLVHDIARAGAVEAVRSAPPGWVVEVKPKTRSIEQNARMWAMLAEVSRQVVWHGRRLTSEEWKFVFSAAIRKQEVVPNLDGSGFVVLGQSTSQMSVREMSELIELVHAFGAQHNVRFADEVAA